MIHPNSNVMFSFSSILSPSGSEIGLLGPLTHSSDELYATPQLIEYHDSFLSFSSPQSHSFSDSEEDSDSSSPTPLSMRESPSLSSNSSSSPSSSSSSPVPPEPLVKVEKTPKKEKKISKKQKTSLKLTEFKTVEAAKQFIKKTSANELATLPIAEIHEFDEDVQKVIKKERRKLQNRIAAQGCRKRKNQAVAKLTKENKGLKVEIAKLVQINKKLLRDKEKTDERVAELEARLAKDTI